MEEKNIKNKLRWCIRIKECSRCDKHNGCPIEQYKNYLIKKHFIHIDLPRKNVK